MRRRHNDPDELETLIEDETGEDEQGKLSGVDNYSEQRNSAKARGPTCRDRKPTLCSPL